MAIQKLIEVNLTPDDMGEPYIALGGPDNQTFSTRDKIMRCTDTVIGSRNYSSRSPNINQVNTAKLGDINPAATFVWGYAKITNQGSGEWQPPPSDAWVSVGGSYLQVFLYQVGGGGSDGWVEAIAAYSFIAEGGELFVEEQIRVARIYLNDYGQFSNYPAFTLNYHLWACTFD